MPTLAALVLTISAARADEPGAAPADGLPFEPGDRVCLVGNSLAERLQHDGWFETFLHERLPGHRLSIRNLGFAADEVAVRQRTEGFGSQDEWLARCRASVVLAFFGFNESFRGEAGLEPFRRDLDAFVQHVLAQQYDGARPPRLVLLGSIPIEDLRNPLLPDGREINARLARYHAVMAEVAASRGVRFVDLFTPMEAAYRARATGAAPLTINGIHLTPAGNRVLAGVLVDSLCGRRSAAGGAAAGGSPERARELLLAAVREKEQLWFSRHQTTDGYNVYGGRSTLSYTDGLSNFDVLQREMQILDVMTANRDRRIWALAQGRDEPVDDSNLPPKIAVRTNIPGPNPDGSHPFLDATAAISRMTPAPGMRVELFADESRFPELANPVQMAFDPRGRLWVAAWPTYPHWEPGTPMRDKLLILEDHDGDGSADECRTFAGDLRDPTGFEFWNGGVFVAQAPDLVFLRDTDGDDVADVRERVLSNLSSADTHHTANSFVVGPDGGLYFQEGTFHQTQIETIHGPERNHDACVWRFEPRTWRVERHVAYNFANPHGHVFDAWGQEFVTDGTGNENYFALPFSGRVVHPMKHSGYFPFFAQRSRPCPATAILTSRHFPPANQNSYLVANVIGFLGIFQYRMADDGSGFSAQELDPLVQSSDPRFRPSDVEVGPDGAVWFLDWYNPIIGHMQHHLRDPNRDHDHGRVYRITCEGRPLLERRPVAGRPVGELLELLKEPEERVRYRVRQELSARDPGEVVAAARAWAARLDRADPDREHHRLEALWLQQQHAVLDAELLEELLSSRDARARAAAVRVLRFGRRALRDPLARLQRLAGDPHPRVRLEAVVAASCFDEPRAAAVALEALRHPTDRFLDYAIRETMRTLEPVWRRALAAGELPLAGNPAGVAWLVQRVSDEELRHLPRVEPVLAAILESHSTAGDSRRAAAAELAALRGTLPADEVVRAMHSADRSRGVHARHVQHALGSLLLELAAQRAPDRASLLALSEEWRLPETGAFARAALIALDGSLEPSWREAAASAAGRQALLGALEHVDPALAESAWTRVRPLMFERPAAEEGGADAPPRANGLLVSYFPVRLRTAAREGFAGLAPAATRVVERVGVELEGVARSDAFALRFQAKLAIAGAGDYSFHLESDDGSRLYVDGALVVDNDLDHGMVEVTGVLALAAGAHELDLCYFDQGGFEGLKLTWSGPGFERQPLPLEALTPGGADPLRAAAIRCIAALPGHAAEKAADAVRLLEEGTLAAEALELLAAVPEEDWERGALCAAIDAIAGFARSVRPEERTRGDVASALELGEALAALLPASDGSGRRRSLRELRGATLLVRTVPHQMLYDRREIVVAAGTPVALVFQNNDLMPHNLVVTAPGALEEVGTAAEAMALEPGAQARSFVPDLPAVLHVIGLLLPGESATLRFVAPRQPGDYPYVCTFPGHWRVMNGVMRVVERLDDAALEAAEAAPAPVAGGATAPAAGPARPFVRMWTLADFEPDFAAGWDRMRQLDRGRAVFAAAGCAKCHWFRGDGVKTAPDLGEIRTKFRDAALLKQILEPSAVIQEGYDNHVFVLKDGRDVIGRIVKEDARAWHVSSDLQQPDRIEVVAKEEVASMKKSRLSPMPTGLLVTFSREEVLDLLAFLQSEPRVD